MVMSRERTAARRYAPAYDRGRTGNYFPDGSDPFLPVRSRVSVRRARINLGRPNDPPRRTYRLINLDAGIDYRKGIHHGESTLACTPVFIRSGQFGRAVQLILTFPSLFPLPPSLPPFRVYSSFSPNTRVYTRSYARCSREYSRIF